MTKISRRTFNLLAGTSALAMTLPHIAKAEEPVVGGSVTMAVADEPPSLVSLTTTSASTVILSPKITEGLLTFDFDLTPKPELATEWEVSEDGLTYTFKLREGVKFHDGTPLTSADVAFSLMNLKKVHPRGQSTFQSLEKVDTPDDLTAVLTLSQPAPYLLTAFSAAEAPIVPRHAYEGFEDNPVASPNGNAPIGTGPFRFVEWARGSYILMERNPDYWDAPKPYVDELITQFVGDASVRSIGLESGEIDLAGWSPVPLTDMERIKADPNLQVETRGNEYQNNGFYRIEFNLENEYFKDVRVRQAFAHMIQPQQILDIVFMGYGDLARGPVTPSLKKIYDPETPVLEHDPDRAAALLDEAGYPADADGKRFDVTIDARPGVASQIAQYMRNVLAPLGVAVTVRNEDQSAYVRRVYTDRDFAFNAQGSSQLFDPTVGTQRFYWSQNFRPGVPYSNAAAYQNPEVDALLEAAAVENDPAKRKEQLDAFQHVIANDVPAIGLIATHQITIANVNLVNFCTGALGISGNFADLYLKDG